MRWYLRHSYQPNIHHQHDHTTTIHHHQQRRRHHINTQVDAMETTTSSTISTGCTPIPLQINDGCNNRHRNHDSISNNQRDIRSTFSNDNVTTLDIPNVGDNSTSTVCLPLNYNHNKYNTTTTKYPLDVARIILQEFQTQMISHQVAISQM